MSFPEYATTDAVALAELIRSGEIGATEVLEEAIARIDRLNPSVNAVVRTMYDEARSRLNEARTCAPFGGVPFLLKDLLAGYRGVPLTSGSRFTRDYVPDHHTTLVTRYNDAGLLTIGKTNTPEFGLTPVTEPRLFGPTRNPWHTGRTAGGSSGGSAAAVALRMVPVAGGGDGGGSIRIPASCCGLFGLKPTRGRTPVGPDRSSVWQGAVVDHVLTWSVRDSAAVLDATSGSEDHLPSLLEPPNRPFLEEVTTDPGRLRIAYSARPLLGRSVDPACEEGMLKTVELLRHLGHAVTEAGPEVDRLRFNRAFLTMIAVELRADIREAEQVLGSLAGRRNVELETWTLLQLAGAVAAPRYAAALRDLEAIARSVRAFWDSYDLLLTPTLAAPPVPHGALKPPRAQRFLMEVLGRLPLGGRLLDMVGALDQAAEEIFDFIPFTPLFNVTGQPAMSVPLHWSANGLPIGMQFVGRYGAEATLFRLAGQLEREQPWAERIPGSARPESSGGAPSSDAVSSRPRGHSK